LLLFSVLIFCPCLAVSEVGHMVLGFSLGYNSQSVRLSHYHWILFMVPLGALCASQPYSREVAVWNDPGQGCGSHLGWCPAEQGHFWSLLSSNYIVVHKVVSIWTLWVQSQ